MVHKTSYSTFVENAEVAMVAGEDRVVVQLLACCAGMKGRLCNMRADKQSWQRSSTPQPLGRNVHFIMYR